MAFSPPHRAAALSKKINAYLANQETFGKEIKMDFTDFIAQMLSEILLLLQICKGYTHETRLKIAYKLMIMIGYAVARQKSAFYA